MREVAYAATSSICFFVRRVRFLAPFDYELARIRRHFAEDDLEERRFPRAVWPDDTDAIAGVHAERDVRQDVLMSVVYANSLEI